MLASTFTNVRDLTFNVSSLFASVTNKLFYVGRFTAGKVRTSS